MSFSSPAAINRKLHGSWRSTARHSISFSEQRPKISRSGRFQVTIDRRRDTLSWPFTGIDPVISALERTVQREPALLDAAIAGLAALCYLRSPMIYGSLARRYARALIELAKEGPGLDTIQAQLELVAQAVKETTELDDIVMDPGYSRSQRWSVLQAVIRAQGPVNPMLENFIRLLIERDRIGYLNDIARVFRDMADSLAGRLRGRVTSAAPLSEDCIGAIKRGLERLTDRQVILEANVEPGLLGGVTARVGSTVYDGSLKSQLEELRKELKQD